MAKIHAPNKEYTGISASVPFANGKAETEDPWLIQWFKDHGYEVEEEAEPETTEEENFPESESAAEEPVTKEPAIKKRGGKK